jgi:RNA polymerase sigma-70 factor (ECF subfamily)
MIETMNLPLVIRDGMASSDDRAAGSGLAVMDEEEFRAFYERTARPLWSYLSRIMSNPQEATDVLQEAYYRFYRRAGRYENEVHRRNSLFRIATNVVRDAARRTKGFRDVPLEEEASRPSHGSSPERQASVRTDLARAMEQLEPMQREMVWLAYGQGASHDEIAEILGLRAISIRTTLLRARRKLAGILSGGAREVKR